VALALVAAALSAGDSSADAGSAIRFFGTGAADTDRIKLRIDGPPSSADVGAGDFTIEFWMKADAGNTGDDCDSWICGNIIFDRDIYDSGGGRDFGISLNSSYGPGQVYFGTGLEEHVLRGDQDVTVGGWHHVAVTRVRSSGVKCLYVDGVLDVPCGAGTTGDLSYPDGYAGAPNDPFLVVGAEKHDAGAAYPSFFGTVDEVRIWDVARSQAQIVANMNASLVGSETGLVLYWRLDEGSGTLAADSSGAGNDGEVKTGTPGAAQWVPSTAPIGGAGADPDGDGWTTADENTIGTLSLVACAATAAPNDEDPDAWPADFNDDRSVSVTDVLALKPWFNTAVPPTPARNDIAVSGAVNIADVLALKPYFGQFCT
jgi:hypothetical protein